LELLILALAWLEFPFYGSKTNKLKIQLCITYNHRIACSRNSSLKT
jgi:hypothetical protein